jgi:DNA sulfur modification protein DndD
VCPEGCPPGEDEVDWRRTYVARNLLPHTLAAFFLFDGEQVQALADRDMSAQVRTGIEGLLGVQVLRELAGDLRKYADNRRYTAGGATSTKLIEKIRNDLFVLEHELNECNEKLGAVRPELDRLTARRDHLTRELSSIGAGGSDATVKERFEELNRVKRALEDLWARLTVQITGEVSLALAGRELRLRARDRLMQEAVREEWEAGRRQGEAGLERFTGLMADGMQAFAPPLEHGHRDAVLRLVLESWDALWHPAPVGTAPDFRHEYAKGADRARVLDALQRVEHVSNESVLGLLKEIGRRDGERQKLENEIGQLEGISPQIEAKATELRSLNVTIDQLSVERGSLERSYDGISSQLGQKRQELARSTQSFQNAAPKLRLATTADRVAEVIDRIIQQAVPHQIAAVAEAMTRAFRAMSHKKIVDRVEIDVNCGVKLLSSSGVILERWRPLRVSNRSLLRLSFPRFQMFPNAISRS